MTFLSRRKRRTIRRASPVKWAATIISTLIVLAGARSTAQGQPSLPLPVQSSDRVITPKFVPVGPRPASGVVPAANEQPVPAPPRMPMVGDDPIEYIRGELPGPQRLFMRESEGQFFDRIRQDAKRQPGTGPAIFPEEPIISKQSYVQVPYPRLDPLSKQPFGPMTEVVEPFYVLHGRLLFEQPNFERLGYDFGIATTGMEVTHFLYDWVMLPYHMCENLKVRGETSAGKCLPGDQAPFTVPIERFSVTGIIGEAAVIIGGMYLFP